jgi:diguanylate cyclase (GGDEF)-like protein
MRILVIDNDKFFCELLRSTLIEQNHIIEIANNFQRGWDYIGYSHYDLIIVDVMLPNLDGIKFCRKLRARGLQIPVMLVTSRDNSSDKILGLNAGADDYVVKSITLSELKARIRALLRRKITVLTSVLKWGDLYINPNKCKVKYGEVLLHLTAKEYSLLELFMQNNQQIHSQNSILKKLWSLEDEPPSLETVRALVKRLRQKLQTVGAENIIETVYGVGYRLNPAFQKSTSNVISASDSPVTIHKNITIPTQPEAIIIVLDDDKLTTRQLKFLLEPWGLQVITLNNSLQLWDTLDSVTPDLLILDVQMPGKDGIELCQMIRNNSRWAWLPILFLTIHSDAKTQQNAFAAGGDDYISKPVALSQLITCVFNRLERTRLIREQMKTDALTGLPNRYRSSQDIDKFLGLALQSQQPFCLAVVTSDKLAQINRDYGHTIGEQILHKLSELLRQELRTEDIISRWNGAEFIIGMYGLKRGESANLIAKVLELIGKIEFSVSDTDTVHAMFGAGVAQYPDDGTDIQSLYKQAALRLEKTA